MARLLIDPETFQGVEDRRAPIQVTHLPRPSTDVAVAVTATSSATADAQCASLAVDARQICRRYGRRWALVDLTLRIRCGRAVMVCGRNGSGKSTLLRVLSTAIRADRGEAIVLGRDLRTEADAVRRRVALLGHASQLYEALSARENLEVAARFLERGVGRDDIAAQLAAVGLAGRADDPVATFSAGMRKRLSLARVLLQNADLVLLDEPYSALDTEGCGLVDATLDRLKKRGATVLMATHLVDHGGHLCDEAVVLEAGRLLFSGTPGEVPRGTSGGARWLT